MSAAAPGPWTFRECHPKPIRLKRLFWAIGDRDRTGVAFAFGADDSNARLIAAAPELLEALSNILGHEVIQAEMPSLMFDQARAAIAKAEGRV